MTASPLAAILWAQWRSMWRLRPGEGWSGRIVGMLPAMLWYGVWTGLALIAVRYFADPSSVGIRGLVLPWAFLLMTLYWQLAPVLTGSLGATLDFRKLLVYPIPERQLLGTELLLRLVTGLELPILLAGAGLGLLFNPRAPAWRAPLALAALAAFNLFLSAGLRNLLERLLARRYVREIAAFLLVLLIVLPQVLASQWASGWVHLAFLVDARWPLPWTAAAGWVTRRGLTNPLVMALWVAAAFLFGRAQFRRRLNFDFENAAASPAVSAAPARRPWAWPARLLRDPLGALVEKELVSLFRTPRFRLLFAMGFSFGLLVWLPLLRRHESGTVSENYPLIVSLYALLLLSEAVIWNSFGFDRRSVELYFTVPVPFSRVLAGKNIAAVVVVLLEISGVLAACALFRLPLPAGKVAETYAVVPVLSLYLLSLGNLLSVHRARPVQGEQTWGRASSRKMHFALVFIYPVIAAPVALAYLARWALRSQLAFGVVLAVVAVLGAVTYGVATHSAIEAAEHRREEMLALLGQSGGPVASD